MRRFPQAGEQSSAGRISEGREEAMQSAAQVIGSFFAAALGWVTLEFVGRPLRRFYDLRGEVIRQLTGYANLSPRWRKIPDDVGAVSGNREDLGLSKEEIARLEKAQEVLRDLASQLVAFASNETCAQYAAKAIGYDPQRAAAGLIGLSNTIHTIDPKGLSFHRKAIIEGLRLRADIISL
jgi:hypothetical protein